MDKQNETQRYYIYIYILSNEHYQPLLTSTGFFLTNFQAIYSLSKGFLSSVL